MWRKSGLARAVAAVVWALAAVPGLAATVVMTPGNVSQALAALRPGDTLRMEGDFATRLVFRNRDFGGVQVDASRATLRDGMQLSNVHNISFADARIGSLEAGTINRFAVLVDRSTHVSFARATVLGNSDGVGTGMRIINSRYVTVRDSLFDGNVDGITLLTSPDSLLVRNRFINGQSDGMKIVDSQRIIASGNSCSGFVPLPLAHPDCIQFWSVVGKPLQSDIYVLNNSVIGAQQGFASFDPHTLSGTRFTFAGNYAAVTYVHAISCLGCTDSRFEDNVMSSLPNSPHRANFFAPTGLGNSFSNNNIFDLRGMTGPVEQILPSRIWSSLVPSIAGLVGSQHDDREWRAQALLDLELELDSQSGGGTSPTPEPATWVMLGVGFLFIGRSLRRRQALPVVLA